MTRSRRWPLALGLTLAGLAPALGALWDPSPAVAGPDAELSPQQAVLAKVPTDATVLINVTAREMPASPDIINLGKRSTRALERCLADNVEASIRTTCAVVLEALGDSRALATLQAALEDWEPWVRHATIRALGSVPDASSTQPLIALYQRKDETQFNKEQVLRTLGRIGDARVIGFLRAELKSSESGLRAQAFDALWASRHRMARATLIADTQLALQSDDHALVLSATLACAELRAPALVRSLVPLMEHTWDEVRNKAVYALGKIGDKTATKALLDRLPHVRDARMLNNIAFALERLDPAAFYRTIPTVAEHKQAIIRLNAAFVLGDVRRAESQPLLAKSLTDPSDFVRTSAVVAMSKLGKSGAPREELVRSLEPFASDPNLSIRQEGIYGLDALTEGGRSDLIHDRLYTLDRDEHADIVHRAALALAERGDPRVEEYLLRCFESYRCSTGAVEEYLGGRTTPRIAGRVLLAWARGRTSATPLIAVQKPPGALPVATSTLEASWTDPTSLQTLASVDLLGVIGQPTSRDLLRRRAGTNQSWTRVHAYVALARLGDDDAVGSLLGELDNLAAERLPALVRVVGQIDEQATIAKLDPELRARQASKDPYVAMAAAAIRLEWAPGEVIFRFLDALASSSTIEHDLAARYLERAKSREVTWLLRRAMAREGDAGVRDSLRAILDVRG